MTKPELIEKIALATKHSKKDCTTMLEATLDSIKEAMSDGEKVLLVGFGSFYVRERAARKGVNPRNPSETIQIPAMNTPHFKSGKTFKEAIR